MSCVPTWRAWSTTWGRTRRKPSESSGRSSDGSGTCTLSPNTLADKILAAGRLTPAEGIAAWNLPLMELGSLAQELRFRRHPGRDVTFVIDSNPNYSNICEADCLFCAFYRRAGDKDAYTYTPEQVAEKAKEH